MVRQSQIYYQARTLKTTRKVEQSTFRDRFRTTGLHYVDAVKFIPMDQKEILLRNHMVRKLPAKGPILALSSLPRYRGFGY